MYTYQNKLSKSEWTNLERKLDLKELNIVKLINEGYLNTNIISQNVLSLINTLKITESSKTTYKVIDKNSNCTLLEMNPITGRKHQLRFPPCSIASLPKPGSARP